MNFGFDFDGTITKNPNLFKILIDSLLNNNHRVFIISGTGESYRDAVKNELLSYDINPANIVIILKDNEADLIETTEWKLNIIDKLKIRCYFENRNITAMRINELCTVLKIL